MQLTRRDALLQTLALAGASGLRPAAAAALQPAPRNPDIDAILQGAVNAREVPGVVAMAATDRAIITKARSACAASARRQRCRPTPCSASPRW